MLRALFGKAAIPGGSTGLWLPLGLVAIAVAALIPRADPAEDCSKQTADLRVQVGTVNFSIPRRLEPSIFDIEGDYIGHVRSICQRPDERAIEAQHITIMPGNYVLPPADADPSLVPLWNVQIRIWARPLDPDRPALAYEMARRAIEQQGLSLASLPEKHGFLAADSAESSHYYIALPNVAEGLDQSPLTVRCSAREWKNVNGLVLGRFCSTASDYAGDHAIRVSYRFHDGLHPVTSWQNLHRAIRAFVLGLLVPSAT